MALFGAILGAVSTLAGAGGGGGQPVGPPAPDWIRDQAAAGRWDILRDIVDDGVGPGSLGGRHRFNAAEVELARGLLASNGQTTPTTRPSGPDPFSVEGIVQATVQRALAAGQTELATRVQLAAGSAAEQGAQREQRASIIPMLTPGQLVIAGVAIVGLILVLVLFRRR